MNILTLFYQSAEQYPNRNALISAKESVSFAELKGMVQSTAAYFHAKGIRPGDRVMVFIPMSIDLYRTMLGLLHLGATVVLLDEWVSKARMEICCRIADCQAFVGVWKVKALLPFSSELRKIPIRLGLSYRKNMPVPAMATATEWDTALITFTTGSTGTPKAAKRTHGFLLHQFERLKDVLNPLPEDIDMSVLPVVPFVNLAVGASSVIADVNLRKADHIRPERILAQIRTCQVTRLTTSPFFIKALGDHLLKTQQQAASLRHIFTGGAPVFPDEAASYCDAFPQAEITILYGSTEAEPISAISARDLAAEKDHPAFSGLKVGKPETAVRIIRIVDAPVSCQDETALKMLEMPPGEVGEIIVSGEHVLQEYFNNPAAIARFKIAIGDTVWHRTGDAGFLDKDGHLRLMGRCQQMIKCQDGYISPFLYAYILRRIPAVKEGTVVVKNHKLILVLEADPKGLAEALNHTPLKWDSALILPRIPRDPRHHSKIDYGKLKACLEKEEVYYEKVYPICEVAQ